MRIVGFTKHNTNLKHKDYPYAGEDSFNYYKNRKVIIAVADGITRSIINMKNLSEESPAKKAADLFCKSFIRYARKSNSIRNAIIYSNKKIRDLNEGLEVDYLENDFWACVGIGGVIKNKNLYYGYVADCGVCVFNKKGRLRFKTKNEGPNSKGSIDKDIRKKFKTSFEEPEGKVLIRSRYRNNPKEPLSYGAFTGEKNVFHFLRTGSFKLHKEDYVLFYSDGISPIISSKRFNVSKCFDSLEEYFDKKLNKIDGSEGTLVAVTLGDD